MPKSFSIICSLLCFLTFMCCAPSAEEPPIGTWLSFGSKSPISSVFVFQSDGTFILGAAGLGPWSMTGRYVIDGKENPRHIDFTKISDPELKGKTLQGIYNIDATGLLRIEWSDNPSNRVSAFTDNAMVLRKSTAEEIARALCTPPATTSIQPEAHKWAFVRPGMSEADVSKLLGVPIEKSQPPEKEQRDPTTKYGYWWRYGKIYFLSTSMPCDYEFLVNFTDGKVDNIYDPFDHHMSLDGLPTVPKQIVPAEGTLFSHYPRFVDARWMPSSGDYPITYEVEAEDQFAISGKWNQEFKSTSEIPYLVFTHIGDNSGRWRVRAKNARGAS